MRVANYHKAASGVGLSGCALGRSFDHDPLIEQGGSEGRQGSRRTANRSELAPAAVRQSV